MFCVNGHRWTDDTTRYAASSGIKRRICMTCKQQPPPTHCKRGHKMSGGNVYVTPSSGQRNCVACRQMSLARRKGHPLTECIAGHVWTDATTGVTPAGHRTCKTCAAERADARAASTECVNGHPWNDANDYRDPRTGYRQCRICVRRAVGSYKMQLSAECGNGHRLDGDNVKLDSSGKRRCVACAAVRTAAKKPADTRSAACRRGHVWPVPPVLRVAADGRKFRTCLLCVDIRTARGVAKVRAAKVRAEDAADDAARRTAKMRGAKKPVAVKKVVAEPAAAVAWCPQGHIIDGASFVDTTGRVTSRGCGECRKLRRQRVAR